MVAPILQPTLDLFLHLGPAIHLTVHAMLFSFLSTVAVLGATVVAQIPPSFTPSAATQLGVAYGATKITPGQQLAITGLYPFFHHPSLKS